MLLKNKKIILGVSASVACYKSISLCRLLIKEGAEVRVVLTPSVKNFIAPLTFSVVSKNKVLVEMFEEGTWNNHVEMGLWADLMLIAPASANTIAKMSNGICDTILLAIYLSARCEVVIAPAMDEDMWKHKTTQQNIAKLKENGCKVIPVQHGELASGLIGEGRMPEPEEIIDYLKKSKKNEPLSGLTVLINAGPTHEAIDPVRYIGNYSSGKMGYCLAEVALELGATVKLVIGPNDLNINKKIEVTKIISSDELYDCCVHLSKESDIIICAAAVADYKPAVVSNHKIKKNETTLSLQLIKTKDTLEALGELKATHQLLIGFALETDNAPNYGANKITKKNLDAVIINSPSTEGTGFGYDTNAAIWLDNKGNRQDFEKQTKAELSIKIWNNIVSLISTKL